jgi:diguanylate cyclase (GGDEF)-like protein
MGIMGTIKELIFRLDKRISLTIKMLIMTLTLGLSAWIVFDIVQTRRLEKLFREQLTDRLGKQAMEDRMRFDRYVKAHLHSVKLFISQINFRDYIEKQKWLSGNDIRLRKHVRPPAWFPKASVLRTFMQPRYALLLDPRGKPREVYYRGRNEVFPNPLLAPTRQLIMKSRGQSFMTSLDDKPYLIALENYLGPGGELKAMLMLASPIDDIFLNAALGPSTRGHVIALLTQEKDPRILISSNLVEVPVKTPLKTIQEYYLVTGEEFFDYGSSEQAIKFASLISLSEVRLLVESITSSERQLRILGLPLFVISFVLLMFWVTHRIQILTQRVSEFSRHTLGAQEKHTRKGDQLYILENRFQRLTEEVLETREKLRNDAEARLNFEKKRIEVERKEKELELLKSVTGAVGVGVITTTKNGLQSANEQMEKFAEVSGGLSAFDVDDDADKELSFVDKEGKKRVFHIRCPHIFDEKIILVSDVTQIKAHTDALEHMALHDPLTNLPNRTLFYDRIKQAILYGQREKKTFALFMIDIDSFKEINDTLGHYIGDIVLKEVGKRLKGVLRESDTIARIGGDEFAILLPGSDIKYSRQVASRLQNVMKTPCTIESNSLYLRISVGISLYPEHGEDADPLMRRADVAMYSAKRTQSGFTIYLTERVEDTRTDEK